MTTRERLVADGLMSPQELAEHWGVSYRTVRRMLERGEIPFRRIGNRRQIPRRWVIEQDAASLQGGGYVAETGCA